MGQQGQQGQMGQQGQQGQMGHGGTTGVDASRHVVSPQLSSISSSHRSAATPVHAGTSNFTPGPGLTHGAYAHVVTPDTPDARQTVSVGSIGEQADREVGEYLWGNVKYSSTNNSLGAYKDKQALYAYPGADAGVQGALDKQMEVAYRRQEGVLAWGGKEQQFAAESLAGAPRPDIVPGPARYLSSTYVKSALEQSLVTVSSNVQYLEQMRSHSSQSAVR
jgi:hypothetical protein